MRIALLSQAGESGRHLRDALAGSGTPIVYEAQATELDRAALEKSGASVVVVNLDADVEAHLDEVYSLLDDARYNVIFNEAQVSSQLSGWEQARWARHLAAKILGEENADPPRPAGSEPVPQRAPKVAPTVDSTDQPAPTANESATVEAPLNEVSAQIETPDVADEPPAVEEDYSDIARLLNETDSDDDALAESRVQDSDAVVVDAQSDVSMPELDLSEFDLDDDTNVIEMVQADDSDADLDTTPPDEFDSAATLQMPSVDIDSEEDADVLGFGDLDD
ncbi:MAG: hypothetical protein WBP53_12235, partial [Dokdonella sp.]